LIWRCDFKYGVVIVVIYLLKAMDSNRMPSAGTMIDTGDVSPTYPT
jgi:hypothetical protein